MKSQENIIGSKVKLNEKAKEWGLLSHFNEIGIIVGKPKSNELVKVKWDNVKYSVNYHMRFLDKLEMNN